MVSIITPTTMINEVPPKFICTSMINERKIGVKAIKPKIVPPINTILLSITVN